MITEFMKITSKGQVTIPIEVRKFLQSDVIAFEIADDQVIIRPIISMAGSLREYNRNVTSYKKAREKAWSEATNDWKK